MSNHWNLPSSSSQHRHEYSPMEIDGEDQEEEKKEDTRVGSRQCIICMEQWGSEGDCHQLCCLPCGHLYGYSCISIWIQQGGAFRGCPLCNAPFIARDVRKIYGYGLLDADLQQINKDLETENQYLKSQIDNLLKEKRTQRGSQRM